jgi:hypothetical protein
MMMQPEQYQPSWPLFNIDNTNLDQYEHTLSPSITTTEDSSYSFSQNIVSSEFVEFPFLGDENISNYMEGFDAIEDMCSWLDDKESLKYFSSDLPMEGLMEGADLWSPDLSTNFSDVSEVLPSANPSLILPGDKIEIENQLALLHLLKAYGEAIDIDHRELAEVIVGCINEKVSPFGEPLERVAFSLFESAANPDHNEYLKQESMKNFEVAFKTFYDLFPYGRFAHFAANSAILESMPAVVETVHVVEFDVGEGLQWAPMIETLGRQKKALRLTCINFEEADSDSDYPPSQWRFDDTRRRLYDHARSFGVKLKVEEVKIGDLITHIEGIKGREWVVFNCMVGLPHMRRYRSRNQITKFLGLGKEIINNGGLIILGDGEDGEKIKSSSSSSYTSFFESQLMHYQAVCESMEVNFPNYLTEARMAMEAIFVAPYVSAGSWLHKYEEVREEAFDLGVLKGRSVSKESLMESMAMVKGGEESYDVRIEGERGNEIVLEWRGIPLVRVCSWIG